MQLTAADFLQTKSTDARRQVDSGSVTVGGQIEVLNPHDIQEVCATCIRRAMCCCTSQNLTDQACLQTILLSNTFNLDEYKCVRLLIAAGQQVTCWAMASHSAWFQQSSAAHEDLHCLHCREAWPAQQQQQQSTMKSAELSCLACGISCSHRLCRILRRWMMFSNKCFSILQHSYESSRTARGRCSLTCCS